MIDLIMIDSRWESSVTLCRTFQGTDISSDHSLVLCNLKLKLKQTLKTKYKLKRNMDALKTEEIRSQYEQVVQSLLHEIVTTSMSVDEKASALTGVLKQAAESVIPSSEKPKKKWITEETLLLAQGKRKLKLRINDSKEMAAKYKKACNEVRKSARKDKQEWLDKQCKDIEIYRGEFKSREVYKLIKNLNRKWQPINSAIKDKNGKILMDKEEIKTRWTEYCSELYKDTDEENRDLLDELEQISPPAREDEKDNILYEEIEEAVKHLKRR